MSNDRVEQIEVTGILNLADAGLGGVGINKRTAEAIQCLSDNPFLNTLSLEDAARGVRSTRQNNPSLSFCPYDFSPLSPELLKPTGKD